MKKELLLKWFVTLSYVAMIFVNGLANYLPLNGQNTGEVSDSYPNLFAPAGFTFAIWGVIYLLLGAFVVYQWKKTSSFSMKTHGGLLDHLRVPFIVTSLANMAWLFSWHYDLIALSTVFMALLLVTLIYITQMMKDQTLTLKENLFLRIPFGIYFGWITIATVANITIVLVKWDWGGLGLSEPSWTIVILLVAAAITTAVLLLNRDVAFGGVILWALYGILSKHQSSSGWNNDYPTVIYTVYALLVLIAILVIYASIKNIQSRKSLRR